MSNEKHYPKIDLRTVPEVPSCGCPFVENDNVKCMNHIVDGSIDGLPHQFVCVCNECEEAMQSR